METTPKPSTTRASGLGALTGVVPYLLLLAHAYSVFALTEDDSYITLRYAANLAAGHGAVYNVGERVEGYTSFLHMLIDAVICRVFGMADPMFVVKVVSLLFGFCTLAAVYKLGLAVGLNRAGAIAAQTLMSISIAFAVSSVNGLETTLYTFLLTLALTSLVREVSTEGQGGWMSGLVLFVATLARPDGMVLFGFILACRLLARGTVPSMRRDVVRWAMAYVVPLALFFAARYAYYGSVLPNTYYAKASPLAYSVKQGLIYLGGKFPYTHPFDVKKGLMSAVHAAGVGPTVAFGAFVGLFWGTAFAGVLTPRLRPQARLILASVIVGQIAFILRSGGDWMSSWRFVAAILPVVVVAQVSNAPFMVDNGVERRSIFPLRAPSIALAAFLLSTVACEAYVRHPSWGSAGFTTSGHKLLETAKWGKLWFAMGRYMNDRMPHGCTVATTEVGYPGYSNLDKTVIDMQGLTDKTIARMPLPHSIVGLTPDRWYVPGDPVGEYLKKRRPDYIVTFFAGPSMPVHPLGEYDRVDTISAPAFYDEGTVELWVFRRSGVGR